MEQKFNLTNVVLYAKGWYKKTDDIWEDLREAFFSGCQSERQIKPRIDCWKEWFKQFKKK